MCVGQQQNVSPAATEKDAAFWRDYYKNPTITKDNLGSFKLMDEEMAAQPEIAKRVAADPQAKAALDATFMRPGSLLAVKKEALPYGLQGETGGLKGIVINKRLSLYPDKEAQVLVHELGHQFAAGASFDMAKKGEKLPNVNEELRQRVADLSRIEKMGENKNNPTFDTKRGVMDQIAELMYPVLKEKGLSKDPQASSEYILAEMEKARKLNAKLDERASSYSNMLIKGKGE